MIARKFLTLLLTLFLFVIAGPAVADRGDDHHDDSKKLDVMTANLYLGADIFRIVEAAADTSNPYAIPMAVTEVFGIVQATNFPERAQTIADEIMKRRPHVIGLQEVSLYRTGPYDEISLNAKIPVYDFLDILMDALAARGLDYRVAGTITNADVEAPMIVSPPPNLELADLRLTDRDVILVRGDVKTGTPYSANYSTNASFDLGPSEVFFLRGYVMVPVKVKGRTYLFVNTHLETRLNGENPAGIYYQFAQSMELAGVIDYMNANAFGNLPVVLVGDLNSDPNDLAVQVGPDTYLYPPYQVLGESGYTDTWLARKGRRDSGETCCHDEGLDNADENFYERIDHVLFRSADTRLEEVEATVLTDKTASDIWASDHGFVSTRIEMEKIRKGHSRDSDDSDDDDDHNHRKGKH